MQTIPNDCGADIHLDYLNDTKIWAYWIMCTVCQGKHGLIFTNIDWFNNNNELEQVYLICTRMASSVHSNVYVRYGYGPNLWRYVSALEWGHCTLQCSHPAVVMNTSRAESGSCIIGSFVFPSYPSLSLSHSSSLIQSVSAGPSVCVCVYVFVSVYVCVCACACVCVCVCVLHTTATL